MVCTRGVLRLLLRPQLCFKAFLTTAERELRPFRTSSSTKSNVRVEIGNSSVSLETEDFDEWLDKPAFWGVFVLPGCCKED